MKEGEQSVASLTALHRSQVSLLENKRRSTQSSIPEEIEENKSHDVRDREGLRE